MWRGLMFETTVLDTPMSLNKTLKQSKPNVMFHMMIKIISSLLHFPFARM